MISIFLFFVRISRQFHLPGHQKWAEECKIVMIKKPIVPTRKVNMYFNRLALTKWLKVEIEIDLGLPRCGGVSFTTIFN